MAVTPDDVRHVAGLARLGIPDAALAAYVEQLNGILGHMDALQRVDTNEVRAANESGAQGMPLREDVVAPVPLAIAREKFAPQMEAGFFLVPRLDTHGDSADAS